MGQKTISCGFCKGKGIDPFALLSESSVCQVCNGKGKVTVSEPAIECPFCGSSGVYPGKRITCTVCGGKGKCEITDGITVSCPDCQGSGRAPDSGLPCLKCRGKGVLADDSHQNKRKHGKL